MTSSQKKNGETVRGAGNIPEKVGKVKPFAGTLRFSRGGKIGLSTLSDVF